MLDIALRTVLAFVVFLTLPGCVSIVRVEKFTGKQEGFRYALPRPYLLVTPRSDGGIDVQPIMLPDSDNEYVVRTWSLLSSYKYDLAFEQGLLKSATGKQESAALLAQLATNTGTVMKSRTEANIEAEKSAAKTRSDNAKAVSDAQTEYNLARAERDTLIAAKDRKLDVKDSSLIDAEVKVARADKKLEDLKAAAGSTFNLPGVPDAAGIGSGKVWGPLLYAVVQDAKGHVSLKAVEPQQVFETIALPTKKTDSQGSNPTSGDLKLSLKEPGPFRPSVGGRVIFRIAANKPLVEVNTQSTVLRNKASQITILPLNDNYKLELKDEGREIEVTIGAGVPSGEYNITPAVKPTGANEPQSPSTLTFRIDR